MTTFYRRLPRFDYERPANWPRPSLSSVSPLGRVVGDFVEAGMPSGRTRAPAPEALLR